MKGLFFRLWLAVSLCVLVSVGVLNQVLDRVYLPTSQRAFSEQMRGQIHAIRSDLSGLGPAEQKRELMRIAPNYGLGVELLDERPKLRTAELEQLQDHGMVTRDEFEVLLAPLEPHRPEGAWLRLKLPGAPPMILYLNLVAYAVVLAVLGAGVYVWVRFLWRDLEVLREHTDRIGSGDLGARVKVSARSQVRVMIEHSNRMADRVAELVQRQRDLTHAMSHELRTPLARLSFGIEMICESNDVLRRQHLAKGLRSDVAELNELVGGLLTYERIDHHEEADDFQLLPASEWLQESTEDAVRGAQSHGIGIRVQTEVDSLPGNPRLLRLALSNLISNAVRHARTSVEVSLMEVDGTVRLRVDDDGDGIPECDRERMRRPFTRSDCSRSRDTGGFGLGLAISDRIAKRHGGLLRIDRAAIGGARVEMQWPISAR